MLRRMAPRRAATLVLFYNSRQFSDMKPIQRRCIVGVLSLLLAACTTGEEGKLPVAVSATNAAPQPTATTFMWFPPTLTPSPEFVPTRRPTPEKKPGLGGTLMTDDFSSALVWNTAVSDQAAVTVSNSGLTIAVQPGIAPVTSFRQGVVFSNMYVEITARPSLCRGADDYGMIFRAPNNVAYYRFAVACNGTTGADRISRGSSRVLQPPLLSGDVPVGAPGEVRLGVWAVGSEFRFFLNGRYQFTAEDKSYASGGVGVFAYAAGATPVTVTFSNLVAYAIAYAPPTPSPMP